MPSLPDENDRPFYITCSRCHSEGSTDGSSDVTLTSTDATSARETKDGDIMFDGTAPSGIINGPTEEAKKAVAFWSLFDDDDDDHDDDTTNEGCASHAAETCIAASIPVMQFLQFFMC